MPDFPPDIQNLISAMLTVDPHARATLEQIKRHPAFRIGYVESEYVLPSPLPMPVMATPIEFDTIPPGVLNILRQIGFTDDDELRADLEAPGNAMAKVFFHMLTAGNSLENVPWDADTDPAIGGPLLVDSAPVLESAVAQVAAGQPVSSPYSLPERLGGEWADVFHTEFKGELIQPCIDIPLPLEVLMANMQVMLTSIGFQWFHPNDFTILARKVDQTVDLVVTAKRQTAQFISMDLNFKNATHATIQEVSERVKAMLTLSE
jgi:BR serine/threonine kinase